MKAVVFDFDEVIVKGSDAVKWAAWPKVFEKYGDAYREPLDEAQRLQGHGAGGDRFTMMEYVFLKLGEPADKIEALTMEGARVFNTHVQEGIAKIGVEKSTLDLFEKLSSRGISLFINTATPLEYFQETVDRLGIRKYFPAENVYGRPNTKVQNFELIRERLNIAPKEILFIGDSPNDLKAAKEFGCAFIAFATENDPWVEGERPQQVIHSLAELRIESDKDFERMV